MTQQFQRRSLELSPDQWANLEALAETVGSIAPTGPNVGMTSWRTLIKNLANHEYKVLRHQEDMLARISLAANTPIDEFLPRAKEWCAESIEGWHGLLAYVERNGKFPW